MKTIDRAQIHRFRDHVAFYIQDSPTVYLTPEQAKILAAKLAECAASCETETFAQSDFKTFNLGA